MMLRPSVMACDKHSGEHAHFTPTTCKAGRSGAFCPGRGITDIKAMSFRVDTIHILRAGSFSFLPARRKMRLMSDYDPFIRGPFTVQARTTEAHDTSRDRVFKCEIWT